MDGGNRSGLSPRRSRSSGAECSVGWHAEATSSSARAVLPAATPITSPELWRRPAARCAGFVSPSSPASRFSPADSAALRCLGLPGNPVAAMVNFFLFGRALVRATAGLSVERPLGQAAVTAAPFTHALGRTEFVPAKIVGSDAERAASLRSLEGAARPACGLSCWRMASRRFRDRGRAARWARRLPSTPSTRPSLPEPACFELVHEMKALMPLRCSLVVTCRSAFAGDPTAGETVFKRNCIVCHAIGPGAATKVGPELNGVIGRKAGSVPGYNYSQANKTLRASFGTKRPSRSTSPTRAAWCRGQR